MVSARMEIYDVGKADSKQYALFYMVDGFDPVPIIIGDRLHYDKMITVKNLVKEHGGANHIKKEILLGNVTYHQVSRNKGVYLL